MSASTPVNVNVPRFIRQRPWWLLPLAGWALGVGLLMEARIQDVREQAIQVATEGARNMFRMVVLTRAWNAGHGGVYVPVTDKIQPNPYLDHPRRDLKTTDGQELTLINPAYMTRLIAELAVKEAGVLFHITSLKPLRPQNSADDWEKAALESFEQGTKERVAVVAGTAGEQFRYMAPLVAQQPCLRCHEHQGYKLGDVRGGISVSQDYGPILATTVEGIEQIKLSYGAVFLLVALLAWGLLELLRRRWHDLARTILQLQDAGELTKQLVINERLATLGRQSAGFAQQVGDPINIAMAAMSQHETTLTRIEELLSAEEVEEAELRSELGTLRKADRLAQSGLRRATQMMQRFRRTAINRLSEQTQFFSVRTLIDDMVEAQGPEYQRLPIDVLVTCPEDLWVQGEPGLLDQVLTNLTQNAVQHGFANGQRAGTIQIDVTHQDGDLLIRFDDDGAGIALGELSRIFTSFDSVGGRVGESRHGLFICHHIIIHRWGGVIQWQSETGKGCHFVIRFPVRVAKQGSN